MFIRLKITFYSLYSLNEVIFLLFILSVCFDFLVISFQPLTDLTLSGMEQLIKKKMGLKLSKKVFTGNGQKDNKLSRERVGLAFYKGSFRDHIPVHRVTSPLKSYSH